MRREACPFIPHRSPTKIQGSAPRGAGTRLGVSHSSNCWSLVRPLGEGAQKVGDLNSCRQSFHCGQPALRDTDCLSDFASFMPRPPNRTIHRQGQTLGRAWSVSPSITFTALDLQQASPVRARPPWGREGGEGRGLCYHDDARGPVRQAHSCITPVVAAARIVSDTSWVVVIPFQSVYHLQR